MIVLRAEFEFKNQLNSMSTALSNVIIFASLPPKIKQLDKAISELSQLLELLNLNWYLASGDLTSMKAVFT